MGVCLDRFSQPMSWERETTRFWDDDIEYEVEEVLVCAGCGCEIDESEKALPSELWEDDYIHDYDECIEAYCKKENDPLAVTKESVQE